MVWSWSGRLLLLVLSKLILTLSSLGMMPSGPTLLGFSHTGVVLSSSFPLPFPFYAILNVSRP